MKKQNCYDIGVIQAFTDGELASDLQEKLIGHIALCESCAAILTEMEEESAFAFSVLDEELNVLVPTERLRTRVFESIKESKERESWWSRLTSGFGLAQGFSFNSPQVVAFASVVLFVSALAIGVNFYNPMPKNDEVAVTDDTEFESTDIKVDDFPKDDSPNNEVDTPNLDDENIGGDTAVTTNPVRQQDSGGFQVVKAGGINKAKKKATVVKTAGRIKDPIKPTVTTETAPPRSPDLSGEDSYLRTIATLSRSVDINKDLTFRPTERVAFEKDMAVVDDAIKKLKKEVRKDPKNQAAREVLRSSYLNKIDLLNSVAEKTELMASIQ